MNNRNNMVPVCVRGLGLVTSCLCVLNGFSKYLLSPVVSVASRQSVENGSLV